MIEVKIEEEKYNINIDTSCSVNDICIQALEQGIDFYLLCGDIYFNNDQENILNNNSIIENNKNIVVFDPPQKREMKYKYYKNNGKDNIGKWCYIFRKSITYFEDPSASEKDFWDNEFIKSQKCFPSEYQADIEKRLKNTYVQINFYPYHLFFSVVVLGDDLANYSYSSICRSLDEAYDVLDGIIEELTFLLVDKSNIDISGVTSNEQELSVWAKNRGLGNENVHLKFNLNFSQIFLITKENHNIDFYIWNSQTKKKEKSTLKFNIFSSMFNGSPSFSIKASIFGKRIHIYDLLQLGDEKLNDTPFEQRLKFLNMLVDSWKKSDYEVVVEGFQDID